MKLKEKILLIGLLIALIVNCVFWFQPNSELMLLVHMLITITIAGSVGYVMKDEIEKFVEQ